MHNGVLVLGVILTFFYCDICTLVDVSEYLAHINWQNVMLLLLCHQKPLL